MGPVTWRVQLDRSTGPGERGPDAVLPRSPSERARGVNIPGLLSFCSPSLLVLHHSNRSQRAKELLDVAVEGCWRAAGDQAARHPSGALDMWVWFRLPLPRVGHLLFSLPQGGKLDPSQPFPDFLGGICM